jgi:membrane-bound lytic murein transglycosylase B
VSIKQSIIDAITRPAEAKPWYQYRPIFLTKSRIKDGVAFWKKHAKDLKRAEEEYGVPPEIIISIIGVESRYGKYKGKYRVLESLATLAFNYPKRSKFFRSELQEFLLMAREEERDALTIMGSYAGAMGKPQFIASSFRQYAVDFDKDGKRDLWDSTTDVIGSVANYFSRHHWKRGEPITSPASVTGKQYKKIVKKGIKPRSTIAELAKKGINPMQKLPTDARAALIELELKKGVEHWLGLTNFYVITRYNHSELYAMAVYQLSQEIAKLHSAQASLTKDEAV